MKVWTKGPKLSQKHWSVKNTEREREREREREALMRTPHIRVSLGEVKLLGSKLK